MISIITVSLNSSDHIESAIQSVTGQLTEDDEFIIVDGCSTDGTVDIIKKYDSKISVFVSERDAGIADAFNKGIRLASGEIIVLVNADDWLEPGTIPRILEIFENSDADVVCGGVRFWENDREVVVSYPDVDRLNRETSVHHAGVFIRRSAYDKFGVYDLSYKYAMDYELLLRFKMNGANFRVINSVVANRNLGGLSYTNRTAAIKETMRARRNFFPYTNTLFVFVFVYLKDLAGRILKRGPGNWMYKLYWRRKNEILKRDLKN